LQFYVYDTSYASLVNALEQTKAELVIHLASLFLPQHQSSDVARLIDSNVSFPVQLLEAMRESGVRQFINTGTSWQHYQNAAYSPVNLYAASKQAFEVLLAYYVQAENFKAITLKLFDTYGPGDTRPKLFSLLRKTARSGNTLKMSLGQQQIDLVFIDDVLDAYQLAIGRLAEMAGAVSESYALSNPDARLSLRAVVEIYETVVRRSVSVDWGGLQYRPREVLKPWSSCVPLPGWTPRVSLADGIARMESDQALGGLLLGPDA
jgi:nucleoside-diphosphate-sugar epimerase